jgi:hypothetical protein
MAGAGAMQVLPDAVDESSPAALPAQARASQEAHESRLRAMTAEQRTLFEQRAAEWEALPQAQRAERRARYQAWRELGEGERAALRVIAAQFAGFPLERQQALQTQFAALDDSEHRGWRLGPALGADYEKLHPLIAYVPAEQRQPLLAALRAMDVPQRAELAVLAQRTPPQDRQALREELLAESPAQVGAWLRRKLDQ